MTALIWLGDKSNEDLGFIVRGTTRRPALPSTSDRLLPIPGRNGAWDFGADMAPRLFMLDCAVITRDATALQQTVRSIAHHLVDSYGKPRTLELRFKERPGQYFVARYQGAFDIDRIIGTGVFSIPFVAHDPYAFGDQEHIYEDLVATSPFVTTIQSLGDIRTPPVIVLVNQGPGTVTHFKIENEYQVE